ncbi:hypothetical protein GCM10009651_36000 [Microbacterium natoriense]|uniref:hypothetical protein n=1 Tax=Microbacterium natoriense TaxID=284570 RepID=UPI0031DACEB2
MPRDKRLYMTFPIDFWTHPKVVRLSDAAFRAFVESNGHSRMIESDGRIEAEDAEFMWKPDVLAELLKSHPTRPLMLRVGDEYVLRDYAEHQFTKADRDALTEKKSRAGRASAESRERARVQQVLNTTQQEPTGIGIGIGEEIGIREREEPLSDADASDRSGSLIPESWRPNQSHIDKAKSLHLDVKAEYQRFRSNAEQRQRRLKNWNTGFTNWLRKAAEFNQQRQGRPAPSLRPTPTDRIAAILAIGEQEGIEA